MDYRTLSDISLDEEAPPAGAPIHYLGEMRARLGDGPHALEGKSSEFAAASEEDASVRLEASPENIREFGLARAPAVDDGEINRAISVLWDSLQKPSEERAAFWEKASEGADHSAISFLSRTASEETSEACKRPKHERGRDDPAPAGIATGGGHAPDRGGENAPDAEEASARPWADGQPSEADASALESFEISPGEADDGRRDKPDGTADPYSFLEEVGPEAFEGSEDFKAFVAGEAGNLGRSVPQKAGGVEIRAPARRGAGGLSAAARLGLAKREAARRAAASGGMARVVQGGAPATDVRLEALVADAAKDRPRPPRNAEPFARASLGGKSGETHQSQSALNEEGGDAVQGAPRQASSKNPQAHHPVPAPSRLGRAGDDGRERGPERLILARMLRSASFERHAAVMLSWCLAGLAADVFWISMETLTDVPRGRALMIVALGAAVAVPALSAALPLGRVWGRFRLFAHEERDERVPHSSRRKWMMSPETQFGSAGLAREAVDDRRVLDRQVVCLDRASQRLLLAGGFFLVDAVVWCGMILGANWQDRLSYPHLMLETASVLGVGVALFFWRISEIGASGIGKYAAVLLGLVGAFGLACVGLATALGPVAPPASEHAEAVRYPQLRSIGLEHGFAPPHIVRALRDYTYPHASAGNEGARGVSARQFVQAMPQAATSASESSSAPFPP